ncbi:MAG: PHP-associated domain-containing protein, partial [Candidatus Hodarchaeota archaeon]
MKNSYKIEQYGALFDAHIHMYFDLNGGMLSPQDVVRCTLKKRFNWVLAMTHDTTYGAEKVQKLAKEKGLPCIVGIEVSTSYNHLLAYGVQEWPYFRDVWDPEFAIEKLREQDCAIFVSHPCNSTFNGRWTPDIVHKLDVDGVEWINASSLFLNKRTREMYANCPEGRKIAGTDAHSTAMFGFAFTQVDVNSTDPDDLVAAMKKGKCYPRGGYVPLTHILVEQLYGIKKKVLKRFKYEGKWITPYRDIWPS